MLGANREEPITENAYENRTFNLNVGINADSVEELDRNATKLFTLLDNTNYVPFQYYAEPDYTYYVLLNDSVPIVRPARMSNYRNYVLSVTAGAYKYLNVDNQETFTEPFTINNPMVYSSRPLITLYGTGNITLKIDSYSMTLQNVDGSITLDCAEEVQEAYKDAVYQNEKIVNVQDFPQLLSGANNVSWTGSVSRIVIEPRWRTI